MFNFFVQLSTFGRFCPEFGHKIKQLEARKTTTRVTEYNLQVRTHRLLVTS